MKNNEILWVVVAVIFLMFFSGFGMMSGNMTYGFYENTLFGWIYQILIVAVLALLIVWLFKQICKK